MSNDRIEPTINSIDLDDKKLDDRLENISDEINSFETTAPMAKPKSEDKSAITQPIVSRLKAEPETSEKPSPYEFRSSAKMEKNKDSDSKDHTDNPAATFSFSGRLDRLRASLFLLAGTYLSLALTVYSDPVFRLLKTKVKIGESAVYPVHPAVYLGIGATVWLFTLLYVASRRLRDTNFSPWLSILILVPPLNFLVIAICSLPTKNANNRFGPANRRYSILTWVAVVAIFVLVPAILVLARFNLIEYFWNLAKIATVSVKP